MRHQNKIRHKTDQRTEKNILTQQLVDTQVKLEEITEKLARVKQLLHLTEVELESTESDKRFWMCEHERQDREILRLNEVIQWQLEEIQSLQPENEQGEM